MTETDSTGKVLLRLQQGCVACDQVLRDASQLVVAYRLRDAGGIAATSKTVEVILPAKEPVVERSAQISDRGTEDEARVVEGQVKLSGRDQDAVEISYRSVHALVQGRWS